MSRGNEVAILWVPAHSGVEGNEEADILTKDAAEAELPRRRTSLGRRSAFHTPPADPLKGDPEIQRTGSLPTLDQSAATALRGEPASEGSSRVEPTSRWRVVTTSYCQDTPQLAHSFTSASQGHRGWSQTSAGGAVAAGGRFDIISSLSAGP